MGVAFVVGVVVFESSQFVAVRAGDLSKGVARLRHHHEGTLYPLHLPLRERLVVVGPDEVIDGDVRGREVESMWSFSLLSS